MDIEREASSLSAMSPEVTVGLACHWSLTLLRERPCSAEGNRGSL